MINFDDYLDLNDLTWTAEKSFNLDFKVVPLTPATSPLVLPQNNGFEDLIDIQLQSNAWTNVQISTPQKPFIWSAATTLTNVASPSGSVSSIEEDELDNKFQSILEELGLPNNTPIENIQGVSTFISPASGQLLSQQELMEEDEINNELQFQDFLSMSSGSISNLNGSSGSSSSSSSSRSYSSSQPGSVSSISDEENETEEDQMDDTLSSEVFLPPVTLPFCPAETEGQAPQVKEQKQERRGRKPTSGRAPWGHLKDKGLRKKEQNKTAATRYRQKKKMETVEFLDQEKILLTENDELSRKREDLLKETNILKGVLRALFANKKKNQLRRLQSGRH